jgi:hypothetical protein
MPTALWSGVIDKYSDTRLLKTSTSTVQAPGNKADGGVVVTAVDPNGVAADHGFQVGDVILRQRQIGHEPYRRSQADRGRTRAHASSRFRWAIPDQ